MGIFRKNMVCQQKCGKFETRHFYYIFGREYNASLNSYLDELKIKNNAKYKKLSDDSYIITYDEYFDESKFEGVAAYNMNLGLNNSYNKNTTLSKNMIYIKQEKDSVLFSSIKSDEYYLEQNYDYIYNILQTIQPIK